MGNLGTTCRRLKEQHESFDARFRRLLGCDREEICIMVRPVVLAARPRESLSTMKHSTRTFAIGETG